MPMNPLILGLHELMVVGKQPQPTCVVNYLRGKNVTFFWNLDKRIFPSQSLLPIIFENDRTTYSSQLLYNFSRADDLQQLTCGVTTRGSRQHNNISYMISLICKYQNLLGVKRTSKITLVML